MDVQEKLSFEGWAKLTHFKRKVEQAKRVIKEALDLAPAYVAISWGKDSTVLLHLCQQVRPDILAFHYASMESSLGIAGNYPEVIKAYLDRHSPNYQELVAHPDWANTPETVQDRISAAIDPKYQLAFVGVRQEESKARRIAIAKYGIIHQYQTGKHQGKWRAFPLANFSWLDIWAYIVNCDLPYLSYYDQSKDKAVSRTNPHARFWFSQDKSFVVTAREEIKGYNQDLDCYLKEFKL
jgi:3'-phosphoadenosine 5'-phosphosulfate sulfotransferase (PAPS reductase)/FAD synthetase